MNQRFWYALPGLLIAIFVAVGFFLQYHEVKAPTLRTGLPSQEGSLADANSTQNTGAPTSTLHNAQNSEPTQVSNTVRTPPSTPRASITPQPATSSQGAIAPNGPSVLLSIQGLYTDTPVAISTNESLLALLQALDTQDPQLHLKIQDYSGLGALITSMHELTNGTNKQYWQYKINGVEPQIGASGYILKSGDNIDWYFGSSQQ